MTGHPVVSHGLKRERLLIPGGGFWVALLGFEIRILVGLGQLGRDPTTVFDRLPGPERAQSRHRKRVSLRGLPLQPGFCLVSMLDPEALKPNP